MKYIVLMLLFLSLGTKGNAQALWGEIRGEVKVGDSLQADFTYIVIIQKGDTICYAATRNDENLKYKSCSLDAGTYDLYIDMRGFHIIKINNIKVRPDAITFQDILLKKSFVQKEGNTRKIIEMEFKPPIVKE